ncbi:aminotransferase class I/II-fold pyridoxal phosphate-dependent enzyme [Oceanobacillus kimchii]|uniref:aminotransferase class I/II-fold pyridoxal phosphate-dependent enzyme n=1 Tax=Oceanobacillus TaxID=182709 RepID=UPI0003479D58|nr:MULTISPECIES: aminotransferase class I/II-fold pyridoxal phosphate-dependent enzyme [Oceanobacillus]MCT1575473.1 aminotransferase class I/II-fold pyridoxal phosphate-dependent enzyme [Oceanobacillus kimchii]MCT2138046.1 aminotransferase class I/II-fold pyridoxal phosphate-dependent enzyme [Oceanobacillus kimchii]OEH55290.1 LL-diaminopimelate aminotransferase [Oceanobacillus sp. E9]
MKSLYGSDIVRNMPAYLFAHIQKKKQNLIEQGNDVIDLGIGAPDLPPPSYIIEELCKHTKDQQLHRYSSYQGIPELRKAVAHFYQKKYKVTLDPEKEVLILIGSKEGIVHLIQSVVNPGDKVILPDPGYPVYKMGVHLVQGKVVYLPLDNNNEYKPNWKMISEQDKEEAKLLFLNYPNNPTGATAQKETFVKAVEMANKYDICIAHDAAYDHVTFANYKSSSLLQVEGAKKIGVELGSLSKNFNMTGWRIGYIVGNSSVIHSLATLKSNIDTSQFIPIQLAAKKALEQSEDEIRTIHQTMEQRMLKTWQLLKNAGFQVEKTKGTIFLWVKVPEGYTSSSFSEQVLDQAHVIVTPGSAFGKQGEGYFRIALTVPEERLIEAVQRIDSWINGGK